MKTLNIFFLITLYFVITLSITTEKSFSQSAQRENTENCTSGDCLLCYLSKSFDDNKIEKLIKHYNMEKGFFMWINKEKGISISQDSKNVISSISILKPENFKGMCPLNINPDTKMEDLIDKYGPSLKDWEHIYRFNYKNVVEVRVIYEENTNYSIVREIDYNLVEGMTIDDNCFGNGISSATRETPKTPDMLFAEALNNIILSSTDNFYNADTYELGNYGKGRIEDDRYVLYLGKLAAIDEARNKMNEFDKYLGEIKLNCCFFSHDLGYLLDDIESTQIIRKPSYISDDLDKRLNNIRIYIAFFDDDNGGFDLYMIIKIIQ